MNVSTVGNAYQRLAGGLGGPRSDPELSVRSVARPTEIAEGVAGELEKFSQDIVKATNGQLQGWSSSAFETGRRDGAFAVPGVPEPLKPQSGSMERPPYVDKLVELGAATMAEAHGQATTYSARLQVSQEKSSSDHLVSAGKTRRELHNHQRGLLVLVAVICAAVFTGIAVRLNEWPSPATTIEASDSLPTATSTQLVALVAILICACGITAGFYRATRNRVWANAKRLDTSVPVEPDDDTEDSLLVRNVWTVGIAISAVSGGLVGMSGYFKLVAVDVVRMAVGVGAWVVWGALAFAGTSYLARMTQHWLNTYPAEVDRTIVDRESAEQNTRSARLGRDYILRTLEFQHAFVISATVALTSDYYEANLVHRLSTRTPQLDSFRTAEVKQVRQDLHAVAKRLMESAREASESSSAPQG